MLRGCRCTAAITAKTHITTANSRRFPMIRLNNIKFFGAMGALVLVFSVPNALAQHEHDAPDSVQTAVVGEPINTMCPVTTDEDVDPAFTVVYEGQTIGFCCRKCRTRFENDPKAYLSELPMLQAVSQVVQTDPMHEDLDGHDHAHEEIVEDAHEHAEGEQHDHATDHDKGDSGLSKLISWIGKFHPPATHLPIGLLIGAALAEGSSPNGKHLRTQPRSVLDLVWLVRLLQRRLAGSTAGSCLSMTTGCNSRIAGLGPERR